VPSSNFVWPKRGSGPSVSRKSMLYLYYLSIYCNSICNSFNVALSTYSPTTYFKQLSIWQNTHNYIIHICYRHTIFTLINKISLNNLFIKCYFKFYTNTVTYQGSRLKLGFTASQKLENAACHCSFYTIDWWGKQMIVTKIIYHTRWSIKFKEHTTKVTLSVADDYSFFRSYSLNTLH